MDKYITPSPSSSSSSSSSFSSSNLLPLDPDQLQEQTKAQSCCCLARFSPTQTKVRFRIPIMISSRQRKKIDYFSNRNSQQKPTSPTTTTTINQPVGQESNLLQKHHQSHHLADYKHRDGHLLGRGRPGLGARGPMRPAQLPAAGRTDGGAALQPLPQEQLDPPVLPGGTRAQGVQHLRGEAGLGGGQEERRRRPIGHDGPARNHEVRAEEMAKRFDKSEEILSLERAWMKGAQVDTGYSR